MASLPGSAQASTEEVDVSPAVTQLCEAFDISGVDGLQIPAAAETRVVSGAFLDGYGW